MTKDGFHTDDGIEGISKDGEDILSFTASISINIMHKGAHTNGIGVTLSDTGEETIDLIACGDNEVEFTGLKTIASTSKTNEGFKFGVQVFSNVTRASLFSQSATLDNLSSKTDTHGMGDSMESISTSVLHNSFSEGSKSLNVSTTVGLVLGFVRISRSPGSDVHFALLVALILEISNKGLEASLPSNRTSITNSNIGVTVEENDGLVSDGVVGAGFTSKRTASEIRSFEAPVSVSIIAEPGLEVLGETDFDSRHALITLRLDVLRKSYEGKGNKDNGFHRARMR